MKRSAETLRDRREEYARLMALEMGKPIAAGRAEADKCAWVCDHYADHAERFLADEAAPSDATRSFVAFESGNAVLEESLARQPLELGEHPHVMLAIGLVHRFQRPRHPSDTALDQRETQLREAFEHS